MTPMMLAAGLGRTSCVEVLLKANADKELKSGVRSGLTVREGARAFNFV